MKPPPPQTSADFIANSLAVAPTASGWADVSKAMVGLCEAGDVEAHSCDGRAPMKDPRAPRKPILQFAPSYQRSNGRKVPRAQGESGGHVRAAAATFCSRCASCVVPKIAVEIWGWRST